MWNEYINLCLSQSLVTPVSTELESNRVSEYIMNSHQLFNILKLLRIYVIIKLISILVLQKYSHFDKHKANVINRGWLVATEIVCMMALSMK